MRHSENQVMKYSGKWYLLTSILTVFIVGIIVILTKSFEQMEPAGLIVLSIMPIIFIVIFIFISLLELNIRIDEHGIRYKLIPFFSEWRSIQKRELESYEISGGDLATTMKLHSKNKINWIGKHKRFIVLGKHLLTLQLTKNRKVTLSTLHPKSVEEALQNITRKK